MNPLFDMLPVQRKTDEIRNLHGGVYNKARAWVDELRMQDRESEILAGLDKFIREAKDARETEIAANREIAERDRIAAHEDQVSRARAAARANPKSGAQILRDVDASGFQVRLHKEDIQVSPSVGLSLEAESYLLEFEDLVAEALRQRECWRTVARVSKGK